MQRLLLVFTLTCLVANGFVLVPTRTRPPFLPRTSFVRPLRDSETPEPPAKATVLEKAPPPLVVNGTLASAATDKQQHGDDFTKQHQQQPYKITSLDKNLWFDGEHGRFYEACPKERIPLATLYERSLDTVEDAILHARRVPYEKGWILDDKTTDDEAAMPTVIVLGSGWASHALIKIADTYKMRLIVVSPTNHFVFTPMLASSAVGTVEYRSMTEAVRAANPTIENYIEGRAIDIDVENQTLDVKLENLLEDTRSGQPPLVKMSYDKLVVAVGCKVLDTIVPGADKYCYKLKSCDDARKLRSAIGECLEFACRPSVAPDTSLDERQAQDRRTERRKRLTWVIVGGGPTGVELAGELTDFMSDVTKDRVGSYHKLKDDIRIILVEGGPCLVPPFEERLRNHAFESLTREGVDVRLNTFVKEVGDGWIKLQHKDGGDIEKIDFGLSVWAAGVAPVPFVETLLSKLPEEARGERGRIAVDKWLRCPTPTPETFGSILVMGDVAAFQVQDEAVLPQTAQVAAQQGAFVARMLDRGYNMSVTPPILSEHDGLDATWLHARGLDEAPAFRFLNLGILAYLGEGKALSQIHLGDMPIFSYAGSVAFMLWRSVYLVKQVATRNRILVLFDWMKCKMFGRDVTRL